MLKEGVKADTADHFRVKPWPEGVAVVAGKAVMETGNS